MHEQQRGLAPSDRMSESYIHRYDHDDGLILTPRLRAGTLLYLGARFIVLQRLPSLVTLLPVPWQRRGYESVRRVCALCMNVFNLGHGHAAAKEESPELKQLSRHAWVRAGGGERRAMRGVQARQSVGGRLVVARCGSLNHDDDDADDDDDDDDYDHLAPSAPLTLSRHLQASCQSAGAAALEKRPDIQRQHRLVIYLRLSAYPFLSSLELDLSTPIAPSHPHSPLSNASAAFDMASSSFRDSMNSLGWSRREQPANTNKQNPLLGSLQRYNPFGGEGNVQLPTTEGEAPGAPLPARSRREEEEGWFALSRWDRILIFGGLNLAAVACFVICFTLLPILSLRPRKFAILGSGRLTIAVWGHAAARCNSSWLMVDGVRALSELLGGDDGPHGVR
ncbi:hypothetical protein D0859_00422 [Hortaea werneckii]|uniref:Protein transport protein SFT2 n=2 Tax=Hortaea werneckii TaxID=91943 RepID=A0A3M7JCB5_HORWE|nr:hypothetical protein D0859_00422 [Hortaea werneckii]